MNSRQKEVLQSQLNNEKSVIRDLKLVFGQAQEDCVDKIIDLSRRKDMENLQTIIYQKQYQEVLKKQIDLVLEELHTNEFATISEYLANCYNDGFIGAMYDITGQGIPLVVPIDTKQVLDAIQIDSKLSKPLYNRLGEDITELKKAVRMEIARGVANGSSWLDIGEQLSKNMKATPFEKSINNAIRISRTEGHRIQTQSALDAQYKAKEKGADVVKQWDASLDGRTRDTHRLLDGQIREIDEDFEVHGMTASAPGMFGDPAEDCNCRCALLQRARWALDEDELDTLKERAEYFGLDKTKDFDDFKKKYLQATKGLGADDDFNGIPKHKEPEIINTIDFKDDEAVKSVLEDFEKGAIKESIETAVVITKNGTVYKCYGVGNRVFPDSDLGDELIGAIISHNHPIEYTQYSFSKDDFDMFMKYKLEILRGADEKYTYEFNRTSNTIDEHKSIFDLIDGEDGEHEANITRAEEANIGYRRWLND